MRVIAIKTGYDNVKFREVGEEFEMPAGSKGSWFKPVEETVKPEPVKEEKKSKKGSKDAADDIT